MKKIVVILCSVMLVFAVGFTAVGYAYVSDSLFISGAAVSTTQEGVFITGVEFLEHNNALVGNSRITDYVSTLMTSTVALARNDLDSSITYRVSFFNNSPDEYYYVSTNSTGSAYSNDRIEYDVTGPLDPLFYMPVIKPYGRVTLDITFSYRDDLASISGNMLTSQLNFVFAKTGSYNNTFIADGNSADNIKTLNDGSKTYNGSNTRYRWTNWTLDSSEKGDSVTMCLVWGEEITFDNITLYHFIDTGGGCDLPESLEVYVFDDELGEYVPLSNFKQSVNYSNVGKNAYGEHVMTIDGSVRTFSYRYTGVVPQTYFDLDEPISTRGIKIIFNAKENAYIGLMELEVMNGNDNIMIE